METHPYSIAVLSSKPNYLASSASLVDEKGKLSRTISPRDAGQWSIVRPYPPSELQWLG